MHVLAALCLLAPLPALSQAVPEPAGVVRLATPDSAPAAPVLQGPPISPRRAFLTSLLLPGVGQAQLDRPYAGGVFLLVEAVALVLIQRSVEDLRIAQRFAGDSVPLRYQVDPITGVVARNTDGEPIVAEWRANRYTESWVRTRRLHLEDWTALLLFNHLFAGADAFVAAQLWDLPDKVGLRQTPFGPALVATFRFGRAPRR